jgi:alpha-mannosidase
MILSFGHGDGGGGPTRDHLEFLQRAGNLEGMPRLRLASPAEFFQDLQQRGLPKERYVGELYFQAHRGTYTSQAKTKQGNRRSEFALREAEFWGTAASVLQCFDFNSQTLTTAWKQLLLNQFHDILPGSSIHRVYEEAEAGFAEVIASAERTAQAAAAAFTTDTSAVTVFNSLSWPRNVLLESSAGTTEVTVPACGWKTVNPSKTSKKSFQPVSTSEFSLENEFLLARFDGRGELVSLYDKESQRELMSGSGNRFCLYKDVPAMWDAWDVDSMAEMQPVVTDEPVTLELISRGPLVGRIKLSRSLNQSTISQIVSLRHGSRRLEFSTAVDWHERHKLLKVAFPFAIHATEAIHEIQFGHLRRPTHRSRQYDADRFEVCNHKWTALAEENRGVAILNDSKYGLSVTGGSINLSLLKSALAPDPLADQGVHTFTYAVYAWTGSFADCNVVREAYELNCPPLVIPNKAGERSLFSLDAPSIILETLKPAEDGSGDLIVRLYESKHTSTRCILNTSLPVAQVFQVDMMEQQPQPLDIQSGDITLDFRPFEIKTLRLSCR